VKIETGRLAIAGEVRALGKAARRRVDRLYFMVHRRRPDPPPGRRSMWHVARAFP